MFRKSAFFILMLLVHTAQADVPDQLKICAAIEDAESRLACFDAIGRSKPATATPEPAPDRTPSESEPVPAPQAPPPVDPVPASAPSSGDFGMDSMTSREREAIEREAERQARADAKLAKKEQKALEKERRKAEKEAKRREREQVVVAKITRVTKHHDGRFSVVLDNGQRWRETEGSKIGIPPEGSIVELKRGRFGGYRMNVEGMYRTAWVKRTQ